MDTLTRICGSVRTDRKARLVRTNALFWIVGFALLDLSRMRSSKAAILPSRGLHETEDVNCGLCSCTTEYIPQHQLSRTNMSAGGYALVGIELCKSAGDPERMTTNLGRFDIRSDSVESQLTICSVTPSISASSSPSGVPRNSSRRTSSTPTTSTASRDGASTYREYVKVNSWKMSKVWLRVSSGHTATIRRRWLNWIATYDIPQCRAIYSSSSCRNCILIFVLLVKSNLRAARRAAGQSFSKSSLRQWGPPVPLRFSLSSGVDVEVEAIQDSMSVFPIAREAESFATTRDSFEGDSLEYVGQERRIIHANYAPKSTKLSKRPKSSLSRASIRVPTSNVSIVLNGTLERVSSPGDALYLNSGSIAIVSVSSVQTEEIGYCRRPCRRFKRQWISASSRVRLTRTKGV